MLIKRIQFKRGRRYWLGVNQLIGVCRRTITKLFCVPVTSRTLWIGLFSTSGETRYREPLRVLNVDYPVLCTYAIPHATYAHPSLDEALKPYIGKTVYLEVWYE